MNRSQLEVAFHSVLLQLEMVSHGTTAKVGYSTGGEDDNPWPSGAKGAEHLHYQQRWARAQDDDGRRGILKEATEELEALTGRSAEVRRQKANVREETRAERDARIVEKGEGWDTRAAAMHFRCAEADVRRARREADPPREPEYGQAPEGVGSSEDRRTKVQELAARDVSERQIAWILGVDRKTVRRDLGKAA